MFRYRFTYANTAGPWSAAIFQSRLQAFETALLKLQEDPPQQETYSIVVQGFVLEEQFP
jgi:hypothetical protein